MMQSISRVAGVAVAILAISLLAACADGNDDGSILGDTDTAGTTGTGGTTVTEGSDAIDRESILGELEDVQAFLAQGSSTFQSDAITDVEYEDGRLTVTASDQVQGIEDAEQLCSDLSGSIATMDLQIVVNDASGSQLAECSFGG